MNFHQSNTNKKIKYKTVDLYFQTTKLSRNYLQLHYIILLANII